tara:strand:+ start:190 stop:432 length:243 start_codon:yes stop_codon:yes gene_type:complete
MEISTTGTSNLISRPSPANSGDTKKKSGNVEAGFISKESSKAEKESIWIPPPTPVAETLPKENTVQTDANNEVGRFGIRA